MKGEGKNQGFVTLFPHVLAACMQKGKKKADVILCMQLVGN
jgi:hypothetical protein